MPVPRSPSDPGSMHPSSLRLSLEYCTACPNCESIRSAAGASTSPRTARAGRTTSSTPSADASSRAIAAIAPSARGTRRHTPAASATVLDADGRWQVRVVPNKFPAVALSALPQATAQADERRRRPRGDHRIAAAPGRTSSSSTSSSSPPCWRVYRDRLRHWAADGRLRHGIVFKNSGFAAGASLEHVHSQLVALPYVPRRRAGGARRRPSGSTRTHGGACFAIWSQRELPPASGWSCERDGYVAVCAYAGRQPYETWILPERHAARFDELADDGLLGDWPRCCRTCCAGCTRRADRLAYNLILHTGPFDDAHADVVPLALGAGPPQRRSWPGFEWGAGVYINPVSPERAAQNLRTQLHAARRLSGPRRPLDPTSHVRSAREPDAAPRRARTNLTIRVNPRAKRRRFSKLGRLQASLAPVRS